ncbi:MAG: lipoyl synthase [Deltaproteobacteria bacterium]|nr:lipoyl synthase [Deltaproteobacteria bacterium]
MNSRKPPWLKKRIASGSTYREVLDLVKRSGLHTVCQEAHCPNLGECFARSTSTFMILGDRCTRNCSFCAVGRGTPLPPDENEPVRVAEAVKELGLRHVVITSVTRDDLHDGGAGQFADTIRAVKERNPGVRIEVLVPDFQGSGEALETVIRARPDMINHNLETVPRIYGDVRPGADYKRSLLLLKRVKEADSGLHTKSGLMLGLGETIDELMKVFEDLLKVECFALTLGQYLAPSLDHHPVIRYVSPEEFESIEESAYKMGFKAVAAGPFVRSSYRAGELFNSLRPGIPLHHQNT